jgi:hypothetical protein
MPIFPEFRQDQGKGQRSVKLSNIKEWQSKMNALSSEDIAKLDGMYVQLSKQQKPIPMILSEAAIFIGTALKEMTIVGGPDLVEGFLDGLRDALAAHRESYESLHEGWRMKVNHAADLAAVPVQKKGRHIAFGPENEDDDESAL